jgi:hypothetical protein
MLNDIIGRPVFFLKIENGPPIPVTEWICPECGKKWAVHFDRMPDFWGPFLKQYNSKVLVNKNRFARKNRFVGRFTTVVNNKLTDTGAYRILLYSYADNDIQKDEPAEYRTFFTRHI